MDNANFTRITAEVSGEEKIIIEFPYPDISVDDLCQAFRTIMVGMTFTNETAGETIASYLMEYYGDMFNIVYLKEK
jgi:hypothetical protein